MRARSWRRATPPHPRDRPRLLHTEEVPKYSPRRRLLMLLGAIAAGWIVVITLAWACGQGFRFADWLVGR